MSQSAQWVRLHRLSSPYPVEVVHAHYVEHRFARHAHEHFVVGLIEQGVQQYSYRGLGAHDTGGANILRGRQRAPYRGIRYAGRVHLSHPLT